MIFFSKLKGNSRIIGKVLLDNKDINLERVKRGLAWHYKQYELEQDVADRALPKVSIQLKKPILAYGMIRTQYHLGILERCHINH